MPTSRMALPLLVAAQAQKEVTHNEALALVDLATQPVVEGVGLQAPPAAPALGQCWTIGATPSGAWSGRAHALAGWTEGGWRFLAPFEGMTAWSTADRGLARFEQGGWRVSGRGAAVPTPTGGAVQDAEARAALASVLGVLRTHGLIAS